MTAFHLFSTTPFDAGPPPAALGATILAAALLLPGVAPVHAETVPERAVIGVKYLDYEDSQSGLKRIAVKAPSLFLMTPVAGVWSFEGTLTSDDVSGASPRYHTAISGASRMADRRTAGDVGVSRYFDRGTLTAGAAFSTEHDYVSRALSIQGSVSTADHNTTAAFGIGHANDSINSVNQAASKERKVTNNVLLGLTQVLGIDDIAQLTATYSRGNGYFSDPYKFLDNRPREHNETAVLARWNHHFSGGDGSSRLSYRYYTDSYAIRAHTFSGEYVQPLPQGWSVTPSARLYSQSAASFYFDPVYDAQLGAPFRPGYVFGANQFSSADQRLSGFGAVTLGIKIGKQLDRDWSADVKFEAYQQRGSWRLFDRGSPGLATLRAQSVQLGLTRQW